METKKATITREEDKATLVLKLTDDLSVEIVLTEDNPNNIKSAFNSILLELKKANFKFELEEDTLDLYYHISKEYILQLNGEINSTYHELQDLGLLQDTVVDEEAS